MARPSLKRSRVYNTSRPCGEKAQRGLTELRTVLEELEQMERARGVSQ